MVAIDREDPWAERLHDIDDVEKMLPGILDAIREWFRTYKIPDGKPANKFALDEKFMNRAYALGVVHETHQAWAKLVKGNVEAEAAMELPAKPFSPQLKAMKTMKRQLSVPNLQALNNLEGSLLCDEIGLKRALAAASADE